MNSPQLDKELHSFISYHSADQVPIVCITSGGTIVPLEKNMVRFIDNFSGGERGATSAECFLSLGYVVIFLHRIGSKVPFSRCFGKHVSSKVDENLLSKVQYDGDELILNIDDSAKEEVRTELECFELVKYDKYYFPIRYETVDQYLDLLQLVATHMCGVGPRGCFYLCAAVSDFYIPSDKMCEHKIQSSTGLVLDLDQVPKALGRLCSEWAPHCFVVSFKLETDEQIVLHKAKRAIEKYGVDLVIANLLQTRREVCYLVSEVFCSPSSAAANEEPAGSDGKEADLGSHEDNKHYHVATINRPHTMKTIESTLVDQVVNRHCSFYERQNVLLSGAATTDTYCSWVEDSTPGGTTIFSIAAEKELSLTVKRYVTMINEVPNSDGVDATPRAKIVNVIVPDVVHHSEADPMTSHTHTHQHVPLHDPNNKKSVDGDDNEVKQVVRYRRRSILKVLTLVTVVSIVSFYAGRRWR